jgi:DUF438 domain-containing protein
VNTESALLAHILDSLLDPVVFCDTGHIIRYMNAPAVARYAGRPAAVGRSIFECHNESSNAEIARIAESFEGGVDEVLITDDEKHRAYMRAVRDDSGALLGYYERYEPPKGR